LPSCVMRSFCVGFAGGACGFDRIFAIAAKRTWAGASLGRGAFGFLTFGAFGAASSAAAGAAFLEAASFFGAASFLAAASAFGAAAFFAGAPPSAFFAAGFLASFSSAM